MSIIKQWKSLLARVHAVNPRAVIAGGAVRDYLLGREIKDLDVWMPPTLDGYGWSKDGSYFVAERLGLTLDPMTNGASETSDGSIQQAYHPVVVGGVDHPVQFIDIQHTSGDFTEKLLRGFDFGICQAAFNGETFCFTPAFFRDSEAGTFTWLVAGNEGIQQRSMARFERLIVGKYQGWTLVDLRPTTCALA